MRIYDWIKWGLFIISGILVFLCCWFGDIHYYSNGDVNVLLFGLV